MSPPSHIAVGAEMDASGCRQDVDKHGLFDDDEPIQGRLGTSSGPPRSASAASGPSACFSPWTAPKLRDADPLSLYGAQLPPCHLHPAPPRGASRAAVLKQPALRTRRGAPDEPEQEGNQVPPSSVLRQPAPLTGFSQSAAPEKPANYASGGVADQPESQVPPPAAGRKGKHPKKVKTAEERLDALSTDLKALTKEWMACKGELITVRSMLATLTGQVNVGLENDGHVLDVVRYMAERPSQVEPPVGAAAVAPSQPVERPRSVRAQARLTMRWFKSLKVRVSSVYYSVSLSTLCSVEAYRA